MNDGEKFQCKTIMVKYQNIDFSAEKADREVALGPGRLWDL